MQLLRLDGADIFRDGGSYVAFFSTDEPLSYSVFLKVDKQLMRTGIRGRHKYLYAYRSETLDVLDIPSDALPVITGSKEEEQIIQLLKSFLESASGDMIDSENSLIRLREMVECIPKREPCFPDDAAFIAKK